VNELIDYKSMFQELVKRMTEEELIRMVRRAERNSETETLLSKYLRTEVKKRRVEEGVWPGVT
jgi:hypothetical protein